MSFPGPVLFPIDGTYKMWSLQSSRVAEMIGEGTAIYHVNRGRDIVDGLRANVEAFTSVLKSGRCRRFPRTGKRKLRESLSSR